MDLSSLDKATWFPGHMLKAERELKAKLGSVDLVVKLVDARAPAATRNSRLEAAMAHKARLILLGKTDLADPAATAAWRDHYRAIGIPCFTIHHRQGRELKQLVDVFAETARHDERSRWGRLAYRRALRVVIVGMPNVGKSTLINSLAGSQRTRIGPTPGVTRNQQWVPIGEQVELLDTPGIMVPNVGEPLTGVKLGLLAVIKRHIVPDDLLAEYLLEVLHEQQRTDALAGYDLSTLPATVGDLLRLVSERLGYILPGGRVDTGQAADRLLRDFREAKLGRISLERPAAGAERGSASR